jgi:hypothetical protein
MEQPPPQVELSTLHPAVPPYDERCVVVPETVSAPVSSE